MAGPPNDVLPPPANKGKQAIGQLSSAPDSKLLDIAEVTPGSTTAFVAEMLCERIFGGLSDVSNPRFLALASHLAYSAK